MSETKRISFDRPQHFELVDTTLEILRDPEPLLDGWERIYMKVSAVDITTAPCKIRFGTGIEGTPKWHEEEPLPALDTYYHTEGEYHCRRQDRGLIGFYGGVGGDLLVVIWHGFDKRIGER